MDGKVKKEKKRCICVSFHPSVFKIIKQRKKREARKHNTKDMTWETFIQIKTLC